MGTESLLIQTIFIEYGQENLLRRYGVAERRLIFLHICKMVLQNNR